MCVHRFRGKDWWPSTIAISGWVKGSILDWPRFGKCGSQMNELGCGDMLQLYLLLILISGRKCLILTTLSDVELV